MYFGWFWLVVALMFWGPFRARRRFRHRGEMLRAERESRENYEQTLEEQRSWIEALETRLYEMEQRLDFTERLLAGRSENVELSPRT
jgi:hypothetical protein